MGDTPQNQTRAHEDQSVLLYDGFCNLCTSLVRLILPRSRSGRLRFEPLESENGRALLSRAGLSYEAFDPDRDTGRGARSEAGKETGKGTLVLIEGNRAHLRSSAALRVAMKLRGIWPLLAVFLVIPKPVRDVVYDWVARNRYRWFGRREACWLPTSDVSR